MRLNIRGVIGEVDSFPSSTQIAISHGVYVPYNQRGKGIGNLAHTERLRALREDFGYDVVVCTVDLSNVAQISILKNNGWTQAFQFKS